MKLGYLTAIIPDLSFEDCVKFASENGFSCIEAACWPAGKAERRYSGVSHIDVASLDEARASEITAMLAKCQVSISAIGYYPNPLTSDSDERQTAIGHLKLCIKAAAMLGVYKVNTFIGKDPSKNVEDNFLEFDKVWPDMIAFAAEHKVKIGIENCPMYFRDEWPGGKNLAGTPEIWREMFRRIDSPYFGLNYDPSHLVWQRMNYINPIYEFADKLFHIHIKDAKFYQEKYDDVGIFAPPLDYHQPKLPGLGDIDWGAVVAALDDVGYNGPAVIEVEDRAYEETLQDRLYSIIKSKRYIQNYI